MPLPVCSAQLQALRRPGAVTGQGSPVHHKAVHLAEPTGRGTTPFLFDAIGEVVVGYPELRPLLYIGGIDMKSQLEVASPGRLKDMLAKKKMNLDNCSYARLQESTAQTRSMAQWQYQNGYCMTTPKISTNQPRSIDVDMVVLVICAGLGGVKNLLLAACAPKRSDPCTFV